MCLWAVLVTFALVGQSFAADAPGSSVVVGQAKEVVATPAKDATAPVTDEQEALHAKDPVKEYGAGADAKDAVKISEVLANPNNYLDKEVTVTGLIVDVCPKRGCWMMFASDKKFQTLRIKTNDGVMVFPLSARGHQGVAKGKLSGRELSQKEAEEYFKHLADEKGEKFDPASVKGPVMNYMLRITGASIK